MKLTSRVSQFYDPHPMNSMSDLTYLIVILMLLLAPFGMEFNPDESDSISIFSIKLPHLCLNQLLFHRKCPGCGLTRSFVLLSQGQLQKAFQYHCIGPFLYFYLLYQVAFFITCRLRKTIIASPAFVSLQTYFPLFIIIMLLVNWFTEL
ncbi:DUF2752 domain-containing protein [candidate division CSSED10-310 bacterium]|uniref:DUF2752 domain-containing protein n=1 Tax=candidate division CSSED10-310 bacterium TaxID=2855610 RepID=A0ABV6YSW6_UNCC1